MGRRAALRRLAVGAIAILAAPAAGLRVEVRAAAAEDPPLRALPLPLKGRLTVRAEGRVYYVDGPQTIPGGSHIRLEANVKVVGINKASLDVLGGFEVHGTQDNWVRIEKVDFSPTHAPDAKIHLDMADLQDCRFVHDDGAAYEGGFTIENSCFQSGCAFSWNLRSGFLRVMTTEFATPFRVALVATKGQKPEFAIRTSWMKEIALSGAANATIRDSEIRGGLDARDFTSLQVDGCDVWNGLTFRQPEDGSFNGLVLQKCNLLSGATVALVRPRTEKTNLEKVQLERFFYEGSAGPLTADADIAALVTDAVDDDKQSVKAFWSKPNTRRHVFLSSSLRRRAPPVGRRTVSASRAARPPRPRPGRSDRRTAGT
jgi:hypothetical protein